ncbi:DUF4393 domain-containing protein [Gottfriedia acidiceleris]|uniref:DUF4393 domain-containing protein n=1 Tax=Gottfriedia acidiceleris TaxID=371036 RepID=UPI0033908BBB
MVFGGISHLADKKRLKHQESLKTSIEEEAVQIPEEDRQVPQTSIVGPALEAVKYYIEEEKVRNMFSKLIVAAMNKKQTSKVHHSYIEIIKQLSPEDALNLLLIKHQAQRSYEENEDMFGYISLKEVEELAKSRNGKIELTINPVGGFPIARFVHDYDNGFSIIKSNVFYGNESDIKTGDENSSSITNLNRLGLVDLDFSENKEYTSYDDYKIYEKSTYYKNLKRESPNYIIHYGWMSITPFGKNFIDVCL